MTFGIPKFEPEVIQSGLKRYSGKSERVPTTAIRSLFIDGIVIKSAYGNANALELMCRMVEGVDEHLRQMIASLSCFGKKNDSFLVNIIHCTNTEAAKIAIQFEAICVKYIGGHGGIMFFCPDRWNHRNYNYFRPPYGRVPTEQRDVKEVD